MSLPNSLDDLLAASRASLDEIRHRLADRLSESGEAVDRYQQICFDLARAAAELAAAEALGEQNEATELQDDLARHFTATAVLAHESRLRLAREELALAPLSTAAAIGLSRTILSGAAEEELGRRLLASGPRFDDNLVGGAHRLLRSSYRDFAEAHVAPHAEEIHRGDISIPQSLLDGLSELGCFGLSIPESFGGLDRDEEPDCLGMLLATEELSRASLGAAGSLITRPEVLARALLAGGTDEQKRHWLPALASGEKLCAVAVTEPDYGSDVASMKLRAARCDGGWRLSGSKMWCTFGGRAHVLMTLARTGTPDSGHRGLSLFLVEKPSFDGHDFEMGDETEGTLSGRAISTLGYRGMHSYELFFDDLFVPDDNLVGGAEAEGRGFYLTMAGFAGGRIQTAARAVGVMQAAFESAHEYAHQRRAFGRPIGDYQLIRVKLARMASQLHAVRVLTYSTAASMNRGAGDVEAAMAKLLASASAESATREALQIHGGMGYAEESDVSRYYVDARVLSIFEGSEEILALKVIARSLLG